jgi:cell division protein FtsB
VNASVGLYRARLGVVVAGLVSLVALAAWFPLGELLSQRGELSSLSAQVASVSARNATLKSEVVSLNENSSVETIAHSEFGLVKPGQLSFVILPAAGSTVGAPGLRNVPIPEADLVADEPQIAPHATAPADAGGPDFWGRFVSRLEFWHHSS